MAKATTAEAPVATKYSKEQLIGSERYMRYRDLLGALLKDGKSYTLKETDALLQKYMKGKVK